MACREAHAPAGSEDQGFAVALDEQVRDKRPQEVAGAGGDDDPHEGELALRGQCASQGNDDLTGNRDAGAFRGHREEDREQSARADDLDELMRHSAKRSS